MKRKDFLLTTFAAAPALAFSQQTNKKKPAKKPFRVDSGKGRFGEQIKFMGVHPNDLKISGKDTDGQLSVFEYTGLDKIGPVLHMHFDQDEIFYVVSGEYRFVVGEEVHVLKEGDTIFLPRNIPHTWIQLTDKGKLIYLLQPSGKIEDFFNKMNSLAKPPTEEEFQQISLDHGMTNVGPALKL